MTENTAVLIDPFSKNMLSACRAAVSLRKFGATRSWANDNDLWSPLRLNQGYKAGQVPFLYRAPFKGRYYGSAHVRIVEPEHPAYEFFAPLLPSSEAVLRDALLATFQKTLAPRFEIVRQSTPRTLRVTLALVDVGVNLPLLSTFARVEPMSLLLNLYNAYRGRAGVLSGSITYWVEVADVYTGNLLLAYVGQGYPHPLDLVASIGRFGAARAGIERAAELFMDLTQSLAFPEAPLDNAVG